MAAVDDRGWDEGQREKRSSSRLALTTVFLCHTMITGLVHPRRPKLKLAVGKPNNQQNLYSNMLNNNARGARDAEDTENLESSPLPPQWGIVVSSPPGVCRLVVGSGEISERTLKQHP